MLYIAHTKEILEQAYVTFKLILQDRKTPEWAKKNMGYLVGDEKDVCQPGGSAKQPRLLLRITGFGGPVGEPQPNGKIAQYTCGLVYDPLSLSGAAACHGFLQL